MIRKGFAMDKILSVGVAAYNMEKYLEQCLTSLAIGRERDVLEILVIDDGSTDGTPEIAQRYAQDYPGTFSLIRLNPNRGYGGAVQKSIEQAQGKYFMVLDADDWVSSESFGECVGFLRNCHADLVLFDRIICYQEEKKTSWVSLIKGDFLLHQTLPIAQAAPTLWDYSVHHMIVKTRILQDIDIRLSPGFYADMELTWFPLPHIETVVVTDRCIKTYRRREGQSTTALGFYRHRKDLEMVVRQLAASLAEIHAYALAPDHMRLMERKMEGVALVYYGWIFNVPFLVDSSGLSDEMRDLYCVLKQQFHTIDKLDFGFFANTLIRLDFRCFLLLRLLFKVYTWFYRLFYFFAVPLLPKGTTRRLVAEWFLQKIKRLVKKI